VPLAYILHFLSLKQLLSKHVKPVTVFEEA
jgi:hypothetical protein